MLKYKEIGLKLKQLKKVFYRLFEFNYKEINYLLLFFGKASSGNGNNMVEFFSEAILAKV